jgi:hypothetical protein
MGGERRGEIVRKGLLTCVRGLVQAVLSLAVGIPLFVLTVLSIAFILLGVGVFLTPVVLLALRGYANAQRVWAAEWSGVPIRVPYKPEPPGGARYPFRRLWWVLSDPATWRDLLWLVVNMPVGLLLGLLPACPLRIIGPSGSDKAVSRAPPRTDPTMPTTPQDSIGQNGPHP